MTYPACSWSDGEFPHETRWVPGGTHVEGDGRRGESPPGLGRRGFASGLLSQNVS